MKELEQLYKEVQPKMFAFFYVKTSDRLIAEDLTHDVFYVACREMGSFQGKSTMQTWLFGIAKNILKKHYRSRGYQNHLINRLSNEHVVSPNAVEDAFIINEDMQQLIRRIQNLDELIKEIVIFRIYGELSFKEIGELVLKSENYVRVTFHRAKLRLQKEMEEDK